MIIKKTENNNEYIAAGGVWVRNFTKHNVPAVSVTSLTMRDDYQKLLYNEQKNLQQGYGNIAEESVAFENLIIASDGYSIDERQHFVSKLPTNVYIFGVNQILHRWRMLKPELENVDRRAINLYIVNNPYQECMRYMPPSTYPYYPSCVSSLRTYHEFIARYKGRMYYYQPTPEKDFGFEIKPGFFVDDYRNPICAAIDLAFRFGVKKLMLLCCDDSFKDERAAAERLENGLYTYPQHLLCQDIVDAKLYWLSKFKDRKIKVADFSDGRKYLNATYIETDQQAVDFFLKEDNEED
jgi:hypothetical protein